MSEAIATLGSVLLREDNVSGLRYRYSLEFLVGQNPDIQGIELQRGRSGSFLFQSEAKRQAAEGSSVLMITDDVRMPLLQRGRERGALVFKFESSAYGPWYERYRNYPLFLIAFVGLASFPLFYLFLGKMLKELNPSAALPSRVRSSLDSIAEALPVDQEDFTLLSPEQILESLKKITIHKQVTWDLPQSRIPVVDDGPENRQLMSMILGGLKLDVELAENGREGLDAAVAAMQAEPYDLIFMDIQMPVMDGYEAVFEMRKAGVETPIVALTANAMKGFESGIIAAGFSHYMVKPIDMDLLGELLAHLPLLVDQLKVFTRQLLASWHLTPVPVAAD